MSTETREVVEEFLARAAASFADPEIQAQYVAQIMTMVKQAKAWSVAHPEANPSILFNYPPDVLVIASVEAAITDDRVRVNPEGRELLSAMSAGFPEEREPTCFMVRMAMILLEL